MEEANEKAAEDVEEEKVTLKKRAKHHLKVDDEETSAEIAKAINKGKAKAIDAVYKDASSTESEEAPPKSSKKEADEPEPKVIPASKDAEEAEPVTVKPSKEAEDSEPKAKASAEDEPEKVDGEVKAQKMRNYFKKSNIYKQYQQEHE